FLTTIAGKRLVVIELGAGTAIPTIRRLSERLGERKETLVVRINPREYSIDPPHLFLPTGALEGLLAIDQALACL
ncbi:MAG TPA: NAD-dependent deacetylase, partial [Geobacterales bacterium]|nr:NAD-dependent deacetylase [Geobacterales bacterium]